MSWRPQRVSRATGLSTGTGGDEIFFLHGFNVFYLGCKTLSQNLYEKDNKLTKMYTLPLSYPLFFGIDANYFGIFTHCNGARW